MGMFTSPQTTGSPRSSGSHPLRQREGWRGSGLVSGRQGCLRTIPRPGEGLGFHFSHSKSVVARDSKQVWSLSPSSCRKQTPTCIAQIGVETPRSHSKHQAAQVAKAYGARTRERWLLPLLQEPPGFSFRLCSADWLLLPSSTFSGSSLPCLCRGFSVTQLCSPRCCLWLDSPQHTHCPAVSSAPPETPSLWTSPP